MEKHAYRPTKYSESYRSMDEMGIQSTQYIDACVAGLYDLYERAERNRCKYRGIHKRTKSPSSKRIYTDATQKATMYYRWMHLLFEDFLTLGKVCRYTSPKGKTSLYGRYDWLSRH